jgi:hypothetical protein
LQSKLQDESWIEVAEFAVYCCQIESLSLKPWQSPPCHAGEDDLNPYDRDAQTLLRKMLVSGVSRFNADPIAALRRAKRRRMKPVNVLER